MLKIDMFYEFINYRLAPGSLTKSKLVGQIQTDTNSNKTLQTQTKVVETLIL